MTGEDVDITALAGIGASTVSDALDRLLIPGALQSLVRLTQGSIVGTALTVQLGPVADRPSTRHLGTAAIAAGGEQSVIVVAGGRDDAGGWGGLLTHAAAAKGIRGVIVDGAARDVDEAAALGFPIFARRATQRTARGRQRETEFGAPVSIEGILIRPGDIVVADGDGVVVVPRDRAAEVCGLAQVIAGDEQRMADRLSAGESPISVLGARYETMLRHPEA